ncbi:hypothetical protein EDB89DRAFT_1885764 [Lactarius sanguifluus]|nr:hypothetical protein EDB89DRAFT_1885764 [Lactarius sanguifluus]
MAYYDTYRDQLASLYHGHALWVPDPAGLYDHVRVGDVGYVKQGHFNRMFNALLSANDPTQMYGVPEGFVPLNMGPFNNIRTLNLNHGDYCSTTVTVEHEDRHQAGYVINEAASASFRCRRNKGAFLSLPFNADSVDAIRTKAFETYIRKHCDSWLSVCRLSMILDVRLEDIILVTGCDLTSSWAMAAFVNSLDSIRLKCATRSDWRPERQVSMGRHESTSQQRAKPGAPDLSLLSLRTEPTRVEYREITLCFHQRISRETYPPLFQDVEGRCGAPSRRSR